MTKYEGKTCTICNLCKKYFRSAGDKVKDNCYLLGKLRRSLCASCILKRRILNFILCFIHNLSKYDAHFIVTELTYYVKSITVIPSSVEKCIYISKHVSIKLIIRFVHTLRFTASKLSTLAENLITPDIDKFRETSKHFHIEDIRLVMRKGVYPFGFTNSWQVLEQTGLPLKKSFYRRYTD